MPGPSMRGRAWNADDRTGGALDDVLDEIRRMVPDVVVERLEVAHPGDDDNVYFLGENSTFDLVQVDTGAGGRLPFSIASFHWTILSANGQVETHEPAEAVQLIFQGLRPVK